MAIRSGIYSNVPSFPSAYYQSNGNISASGQTNVVVPAMDLDIGGSSYRLGDAATLSINTSTNWDDISVTDYSSAANRAGKDFYVYACQPESGITPTFLLSPNSTYPSGYTASNSRKIGGFHTLCGSVGTISGHSLTGYLTGSVLPYSVWDLKHRSASGSNIGQVYIPEINKWVGIYFASGTSAAPTIVFGGTILDTITYFASYAACRVLKGQLPKDSEFAAFAAGSNEATNILGSADPVTVTAAVDTAGRRMISNYGVESAAGSMWQWLCDTSYRFNGATAHTHSVTVSGDPQTVTSGNASADVAPAWSWKANTGGKGSLYTQGTYGTTKLFAGGHWDHGAGCGSRARSAAYYPWTTFSILGFRPIFNNIEK
mgnify:CR=1 FL=1